MYSYDDDDEDEQHSKERPRDNLKKFVLEAVPFKMIMGPKCPITPLPDERIQPDTRAVLTAEPDSRRRLKEICILQPSKTMQNRIRRFVSCISSQPFPNQGYDVEIIMDAPSFDVPQIVLPMVEHIGGVVPLVLSIMSTAERILKLTWPEETAGYIAHVPALPHLTYRSGQYTDYDVSRIITWKKVSGESQSLRESVTKMVVLTVVPWGLGALEMKDFIKLAYFVPYRETKEDEPPHRYTRVEKVWAKLWDECASKNCQYFAVTNYDCWVFGVFVKGSTRAICTHVINAMDKEPSTLLQWIMFWMGCSIQLPHTWRVPAFEKYGNPDISDPNDVATRLMEDKFISEEDWLKENINWLEENITEDDENRWQTHELAPNIWYTGYDSD